MGLDAKGLADLLDQLVTASQESGVSVDATDAGHWAKLGAGSLAGGDIEDLTSLVVQQAQELRADRLARRDVRSIEEVDKGLIPTVGELFTTRSAIGRIRVEKNYQAGRTWRDTISETKDAVMAAIGPYGDMVGAIGSTASGLALAGPQMLQWIKSTKAATPLRKPLIS